MINVSDESKYSVSSSTDDIFIASYLTIMNAQSNDAGIYTCEAENFIGNDSSSGVLTINGKYMIQYVIIMYYLHGWIKWKARIQLKCVLEKLCISTKTSLV